MSNTQLTTNKKPSALALMAERCSIDPVKLHHTLKNTVFKGASDDELVALVITANQYGLNPLLKEMYAFPQKGGGIVPFVSIDGWLRIVNRQPNFDGMEADVFPIEGGEPTHATCTIYLKDRSHPVKVTEYFSECSRNTEPWKTMPRRMLRHKAIIQTARVAFGLGGIFDEDEARDQVREIRDVTPKVPESNPFKKETPPALSQPKEPEPEPEPVEEEPPVDDPEFVPNSVYVEKVESKSSGPDAKKPWQMWKLEYSSQDGFGEAVTFSKSIGAQLDAFEEGDQVLLVTKQGDRGELIESVEKVELPEELELEGAAQ